MSRDNRKRVQHDARLRGGDGSHSRRNQPSVDTIKPFMAHLEGKVVMNPIAYRGMIRRMMRALKYPDAPVKQWKDFTEEEKEAFKREHGL